MQEAYSRNMAVAALTALVRPGPMLKLQADGKKFTYLTVLRNALAVLFPLLLAWQLLWGTWWYVVIHQQQSRAGEGAAKEAKPGVAPRPRARRRKSRLDRGKARGAWRRLRAEAEAKPDKEEALQEMGSPELSHGHSAPSASGPPEASTLFLDRHRADGARAAGITGSCRASSS
jgi:hypothetical protein